MLREEPDGTKVYAQGCPWKQIDRYTTMVYQLYRHWSKGVLLVAGGLLDQPAWYVSAMEAMDNAVGEMQREKLEQQQGLAGKGA